MAKQNEPHFAAGNIFGKEDDFAPQPVENPLEISSARSTQTTHTASIVAEQSVRARPNAMKHQDPLDHHVYCNDDLDEAPLPYSDFERIHTNTPRIAAVEYSSDSSPQLLVAPQAAFPEAFERSTLGLSARGTEATLTPSTALGSYGSVTPSTALESPVHDSLRHAPLRLRHFPANNGQL